VLADTVGKHRHQTPAWRASYNRRNLVEGDFGVMKSMAGQAMVHGRTQVRGRVKNTLLLTCIAIGTNLRLTRAWRDKAAKAAASTHTIGGVPTSVERLLEDTAKARSRKKRRSSSFATLIGVRDTRRPARARGPG
jgi:hypothetical protein